MRWPISAASESHARSLSLPRFAIGATVAAGTPGVR